MASNKTEALKTTGTKSIQQRRRLDKTMSIQDTGVEDDHEADWEDEKLGTETFGLYELRDGFFDAIFPRPTKVYQEELLERAKLTLPSAFDKEDPLSVQGFLPTQWRRLSNAAHRICFTYAGFKLAKSFVAFFVAYCLCLSSSVQNWLGQYSYFMVVSTITNHPGRTFGAQLDGLVLTIAGIALGIGAGCLALLLSTATAATRAGYGGILALTLVFYFWAIALFRAYIIRFYQFVLCAGIAILFVCLADVDGQVIEWDNLYACGIAWLIGQAIALVVNVGVFPDTGSRSFALCLNGAFKTMLESLEIPRPTDLRLQARLGLAFVEISEAYRDLVIDFSVTRFHPGDMMEIRNLMQACIRSLLALRTETRLFDDVDDDRDEKPPQSTEQDTKVPRSSWEKLIQSSKAGKDIKSLVAIVTRQLSGPTREVLNAMTAVVLTCDVALMTLTGHRNFARPSKHLSATETVEAALSRLARAGQAYDAAEEGLLETTNLPSIYSVESELVELFVFARYVRLAAKPVAALASKVKTMQPKSRRLRINPPTYPFWKALNRTNAQVRHDRGGVVAGSAQITFSQIAEMVDTIKAIVHRPTPRVRNGAASTTSQQKDMNIEKEADQEEEDMTRGEAIGHSIWKVMHEMQGFQSRYALKVILLMCLLSVPAWMDASDYWWNEYEAWWAVVMAWIVMHPRVGGNVQDLFMRATCAILGAVWAGLAYKARNGNPIVMGAFAAVFMVPMIYRFTLSSSPRSGFVGCLSFSVISLSLYSSKPDSSIMGAAMLRGLAFFIGVIGAGFINWALWPFIARHELRKALSSMMFFLCVIYRRTVAKYIYFEEGEDPTEQDIHTAEILEGRLREGFVRIRQLLELTRNEIRLRAPFDPLPFSALTHATVRFYQHLLDVRQASLFYSPSYLRSQDEAAAMLLSFRRDAVAAVIGNLYVLAGALLAHRKVPRYLPSAHAARVRLIAKMTEVEEQLEAEGDEERAEAEKKWQQIFSYSFNESFNGCVAQLEEMETYTKMIVGEQGFDDQFDL